MAGLVAIGLTDGSPGTGALRTVDVRRFSRNGSAGCALPMVMTRHGDPVEQQRSVRRARHGARAAFAVALTATLIVALAGLLAAPARAQIEDPAEVMAVAHRGGSAYAPENTLTAIENAARLGVDAIEFDVVFSADDELVVIHDDTLERTTDCEGAVVDKTLEELKACDAAHWFTPGEPVTVRNEDGTHPLRGTGVTIPTLDEVFTYFASLDEDAPLPFVEVKSIPGEENFDPVARAYAEEVLRLADEHGLTDRIVVLSFWPLVIDNVQQLDPDVRTLLLTTSEVGITASMGASYVIARDHDFAGPNHDAPDFTREYVQMVHEAGKQVSTWTVNTVEDLETVLGYGPDAITTDFPGCLLGLQERLARDVQLVPDPVIAAGAKDLAACPEGAETRPEEVAAPAEDEDDEGTEGEEAAPPADDERPRGAVLPVTGGPWLALIGLAFVVVAAGATALVGRRQRA